MEHSETKAQVRDRARASRRAGPPADPRDLARQCLAFLDSLPGPARVTCYASYGTEPDTSAIIDALKDAGFEVLLPRVEGDAIAWVPHGGPARMSAMGIVEPLGEPVPILPVRALLVPALAASADGARLGKGGGFYDRVIAGLPSQGRPLIAAIVRDEDVLEDGEIPMDAHDEYVDAVITPTRTLRRLSH